MKLENNASGDNKICEIELSAPGPRLFATSKSANFEKAVVSTTKELEHQLNEETNVSKSLKTK